MFSETKWVYFFTNSKKLLIKRSFFIGALEKTDLVFLTRPHRRALLCSNRRTPVRLALVVELPCGISRAANDTNKKTPHKEEFFYWCPGEDSNFHCLRQHAPEACASTNFATRAFQGIRIYIFCLTVNNFLDVFKPRFLVIRLLFRYLLHYSGVLILHIVRCRHNRNIYQVRYLACE